MPQVAADYGISSYFRDPRGVWVNLYIPSTAHWMQDGAQVSLSQRGDYPYDQHVAFGFKTSKAARFAVNLRIPAWADGASVTVNGKRQEAEAGSFAMVERDWKDGDRIELELPLKNRLEAVDAQHADTAAFLAGPLVLFALADSQPSVTRTQLLAAKQIGRHDWQLQTAGGPMKMLPWTALDKEQPYATYLKVT
jgi:hypothetical protein